MQYTLATLEREAAKIGATVDKQSLIYGWVNVDAPPGKVWACSGDIHALCVSWHQDGPRPTWPEDKRDAIKDALDRMAFGLCACDVPDCDVCEENQ